MKRRMKHFIHSSFEVRSSLKFQVANLHNLHFAVFSEYRYNTSVNNPCHESQCTHLCLLIPGGFRCACPDNGQGQSGSEVSCDALVERQRPSPLRCPCQNRGVCTDDGKVQCECPPDFEGVHCETHLLRRPAPSESVPPASIIAPVVVIIFAALIGAAVYVFFFRRAGRAKGSGFTGFGTSPSVSFRQGTNVEFGPTVFSGNGASTAVSSPHIRTSVASLAITSKYSTAFLVVHIS